MGLSRQGRGSKPYRVGERVDAYCVRVLHLRHFVEAVDGGEEGGASCVDDTVPGWVGREGATDETGSRLDVSVPVSSPYPFFSNRSGSPVVTPGP